MNNFVWGSDSTGTAGISTITVYNSPSAINTTLKDTEVKVEKPKKGISPKLYFNYIKSEMKEVHIKQLEHRLKKLYLMIEECKEIGQDGLAEEMIRLLAVTAREQQAYVYGVKKWVDEDVIDKFKSRVSMKIKFKPLDEFPRIIPKDVILNLKELKKVALFDDYYVLFTDITGEETLSTEKKIMAKDPILFGRYAYQPKRWYLIADWVDEYCDLTIDKFVNQVGIYIEDIPEVNDRYITKMKEHAMFSYTKLKETKRSNFKEFAQNAKKAFKRLFK